MAASGDGVGLEWLDSLLILRCSWHASGLEIGHSSLYHGSAVAMVIQAVKPCSQALIHWSGDDVVSADIL